MTHDINFRLLPSNFPTNARFTILGPLQDKESSHSSKLFTKNCKMLRRPLSSEDKYKNPGFM